TSTATNLRRFLQADFMSAGLTQVSRFPQDSLKATALTPCSLIFNPFASNPFKRLLKS
ncbi:MAG: hypothetical protein ACI957_004310, partial [Verrucomicrobiales bacterium]